LELDIYKEHALIRWIRIALKPRQIFIILVKQFRIWSRVYQIKIPL